MLKDQKVVCLEVGYFLKLFARSAWDCHRRHGREEEIDWDWGWRWLSLHKRQKGEMLDQMPGGFQSSLYTSTWVHFKGP